MSTQNVQPLVAYQTSANSESVLTVLQLLRNGVYEIAEFQRDSDQWDTPTKSLFIESVLNNLSIPAFFLAPTSGGKFEIIDGQQRLTTLKEFYENKWPLVDADEADYLGQQSVHYAGKNFQDLRLPNSPFAQSFENYLLSLIKLPQGVSDSTKREIFRRINQAGTPLSAQDIRLAYWGKCRAVSFIRLVGIYDETREGSQRMIKSANNSYGLDWPWQGLLQAMRDNWKQWWDGKQTAIGQTASEMFLWFLIAKHIARVDSLLSNQTHLASALNTTFDGRTEEAADIFSAQLHYESQHASAPTSLCSATQIESTLFPTFANWWYQVNVHVPNISLDRNRRVAILIAALSGQSSQQLTASQWDLIDGFIHKPRITASKMGIDVPESKGRWKGSRGQKAQIDAYGAVAKKILATP